MLSRPAKLKHNFRLMFWIQALTSVQVIGTISTIFMVYRGLSLSQIFYTAICFSLVTLAFEVPSSYLADRWGRKKVVILSCFLYLSYWIVQIFAHSFPLFMLAIGIYACSNAMLSGTDEALIYDTAQELGQEDHSLKQLGKYFSAQRIFKIIVPLIAVFIAKDLSDAQFIIILLIDVIAATLAICVSYFLTEPIHAYSREKAEAGIMRDTLALFHRNFPLLNMMLNKTLLFVAAFILWRVGSDFFLKNHIPLLTIGLTTMTFQALGFIMTWNIAKFFPTISIASRINFINFICTLSLGVFFANSLMGKNVWIYLTAFIVCMVSEMLRWPLYSQLINNMSSSYNRATVLSMSNIFKSFIDVPLLFLSAYLVSFSYPALFGLSVTIALISTFVFFLRPSMHQLSR